MQFFLYYVFWPFMGGFVFIYLGLVEQSTMWWFLVLWFLPWITWPIGMWRRRQAKAWLGIHTEALKKSGEPNISGALLLALAPPLIMLLSGMLGTVAAPIYMEDVLGIDVEAKIEELQKQNEQSNGH